MQNLKSQFLLREDITFLNFGSFGACPKPVFERYQQYQLELEQEPVNFVTSKALKYLDHSREALGNYVNCHKNDLVYVTNPSYAVNTVAKSLDLKEGDEVLTTDLEYGACDKTWDYYCRKAKAKYVRQPIPLPIESKEHFFEAFFKGLTAKTKLIFISHITSTTGLRFPVEEICAIAKEKGILTFVDGAHAPGHILLDLQTLNADFYTGACHKWMMTPKGSSFLYVRKELQSTVDPLIISWGYNAMFPSDSQFIDYHQMNGSRDLSAFLSIPAAINFMQEHDWKTVAASCRNLVQENIEPFCKLLGASPLSPLNDDFNLQLFSAEIKTTEPEQLHDLFFEKYKIQIPVMRHGDKVYLRYSINAFNDQGDMDKLFAAIKDIKNNTAFIN
ncbi:MAG: aminotransferase class V-fold PLP-dependent enzyme [Chitinophagaceae bacterium]|nr:aminotransferase class V-fold PLP-dependent enzyme [Chitinophagaceae bacterium]MBP7108442.1 aminotransferase class V-fold PLP-dependent enzyme [Chitinophagaceae bacterium]MBP7313877.1 aminotransferase class V-fold PLP-dependent enzyme [Chitinophagaceae bacterium]HQZ49310.1 aminotransferase class V-fold PLP-dependent enzyme [Chitinophagaceae bacterium]